MKFYCLNCGALLGVGLVYCLNCGTPVAESVEAETEQETVIRQSPPIEPTRANLPISRPGVPVQTLVAGAVGIVAVIAIALWSYQPPATPPVTDAMVNTSSSKANANAAVRNAMNAVANAANAAANAAQEAANRMANIANSAAIAANKPANTMASVANRAANAAIYTGDEERPSSGCYLWSNTDPIIPLRRNCSQTNCNLDETAIVNWVANGTRILLSNAPSVPGRRSYNWQVVQLDGEAYYVASNKIYCN